MRSKLFCALVLALVLAPACSPIVGPDGSAVGRTCLVNSDCDQFCLPSDKHYPGGMCTYHCSSDGQCPGGTVCIDDQGGTCAVACANNDQCLGFGRGFVCDTTDRLGAGGPTQVCRVP